MADALAGNPVRAADHVDTLVSNMVLDTAVGTASAGFTTVSSTVRTALGGKLVWLQLEITSTNAITATSGNITDTACFTLDAEYRPTEIVNAAFGGNMVGECTLSTAGVVLLRAASDNIGAGTTFRVTFMYLRG